MTTTYIDYYSTGFTTREETLQAIENTLVQGAEAVTDPFQIFKSVGIDPSTMLQVIETVDNLWYFNARSSVPLTGNWITPNPAYPYMAWA
jgi:hypothetical protein